MVESGDREDVKDGDNGKAIGPYQIHKVYWEDSRVSGKYEQCRDTLYATRVVRAYWIRYGGNATSENSFIPEKLARIHNGGPKGFKKSSTLGYWKKVKKYYEQGD